MGVTANLAIGIGTSRDAAGNSYLSVENIVGSNFGDVLIGKAGIGNILNGGLGNDFFYGEGIDTFVGGAGSDTLFTDPGAALNLNVGAPRSRNRLGRLSQRYNGWVNRDRESHSGRTRSNR